MRARCLRTELPRKEAEELGLSRDDSSNRRLTAGKTYLVLGIVVRPKDARHGAATFLQVQGDAGLPTWALMQLFEIVDPRASRHWELRPQGNDGFALLPTALFELKWWDGAYEFDPYTLLEYRVLYRTLDEEYDA